MTASEQTATSSRAVPPASRTYHRAARRSTRRPRPHAPTSARDPIACGSPKRSYRANHAPRRSVRVERAPATFRSSHPGDPGNAAKSDRLRKDGPREWPSHAHLRKQKGRSRPVQAHSRACRCPPPSEHSGRVLHDRVDPSGGRQLSASAVGFYSGLGRALSRPRSVASSSVGPDGCSRTRSVSCEGEFAGAV
jgi:hypothetical protein